MALYDTPITNLNLKLLQTFVLVAEHQSFRHAADASLRSQSAISVQIKQLEEQIGFRLLHRTTRHVELTVEGRQLFDTALSVLTEIDHCIRTIQETIDFRRGRVTIACSPTIASARLSAVLGAFEADYPEARVIVRELNPTLLFDSVRSAEVDFAIGPYVSSPDFDFEEILREPLYAVVPDTLDRSSAETIGIHELAEFPLLLLNRASALRTLLNSAFETEGIELTTKFEFSQATTLVEMARMGLGVAILPECVVPRHPEQGCNIRRISAEGLYRTVTIIKRRGLELTPTAAHLAQRARELIGRGVRDAN